MRRLWRLATLPLEGVEAQLGREYNKGGRGGWCESDWGSVVEVEFEGGWDNQRVVLWRRGSKTPWEQLQKEALEAQGLGLVVKGQGRLIDVGALTTGDRGIEEWVARVFEGGADWLREVVHSGAGTLPGVTAELERLYIEIKGEAERAEIRGESGPRSELSLRRRAGAMLLHHQVSSLLWQRKVVTAKQARRLVAVAAQVAKGVEKAPKAHYANLYDLKEAMGAVERKRGEGVALEKKGEMREGEMASVDTQALAELWEKVMGPMEDNHPLLTLLHESKAHSPRFHPTLAGLLEEAKGRGEALQFLPAAAEKLSVAAFQGLWDTVEELRGKCIVDVMSRQQYEDPEEVALVVGLRAVFKGPPKTTDRCKQVMETGTLGEVAEEAELWAQWFLKEVELEISRDRAHCQLHGGKPYGAGEATKAVLARTKDVWTKVRLVTQYFPMKRGGKGEGVKSGIVVELPEEEGLLPSSCANPTADDMVEDGVDGVTLGKRDSANWFFQHSLLQGVRKYFCVRVTVPEEWLVGRGEVTGLMKDKRGWFFILRFNRLPMGGRSCPLVGQSVSSIVALLVEGMVPGCRVYPVQDDLCLRARGKAMEVAMDKALDLVFATATIEEKTSKRVAFGEEVELVGRLVNAREKKVALPRAKRFTYLAHAAVVKGLLEWEGELRDAMVAEVTTESMQTLVGRLEWWGENTRRGVTSLAPLYAVAKFGHAVAGRTEQIIKALDWWLRLAREGRLKDEMLLGEEYEAQESVWSDCGDGAAGAWWIPEGGGPGQALWVKLTVAEKAMGSGPRELLSLRRALEKWGARWRRKTVFWCTDSEGSASAVNSGRQRGANGTREIEGIFDWAEKWDINLVAVWVPREMNKLADAFTRCEAREEAEALAQNEGMVLMQ